MCRMSLQDVCVGDSSFSMLKSSEVSGTHACGMYGRGTCVGDAVRCGNCSMQRLALHAWRHGVRIVCREDTCVCNACVCDARNYGFPSAGQRAGGQTLTCRMPCHPPFHAVFLAYTQTCSLLPSSDRQLLRLSPHGSQSLTAGREGRCFRAQTGAAAASACRPSGAWS